VSRDAGCNAYRGLLEISRLKRAKPSWSPRRRHRLPWHGPITCASVPIEDVNWAPFDIISVGYYRGRQNRTTYGPRLERYTS